MYRAVFRWIHLAQTQVTCSGCCLLTACSIPNPPVVYVAQTLCVCRVPTLRDAFCPWTPRLRVKKENQSVRDVTPSRMRTWTTNIQLSTKVAVKFAPQRCGNIGVSCVMLSFFKTAAGVTTMWGLCGIAIVALLYISIKQRGKPSPTVWGVIAGIVLLALVPTVGRIQIIREQQSAFYDLRVTVLDAQKIPVDDARVWASINAIPKKVEGGWEFSIPSGSKPADGKLTVYAQNSFLTGRTEVQLKDDHHPTATLQLMADETSQVRGMVQDAAGRAVAGALVSIVGYGGEALTTNADGSFALPAHTAEGQQVELHAEKQSYRPVNQWCPAGKTPATLVLERR